MPSPQGSCAWAQVARLLAIPLSGTTAQFRQAGTHDPPLLPEDEDASRDGLAHVKKQRAHVAEPKVRLLQLHWLQSHDQEKSVRIASPPICPWMGEFQAKRLHPTV